MENRSLIFLVTQKDARVDDPEQRHLYSLGTLASVMQLLRLPDGTIKALVEGKRLPGLALAGTGFQADAALAA